MKKQRMIITIILSFLLISLIICQCIIIYKSNKKVNDSNLTEYLLTDEETMTLGKTKQKIENTKNYSYAINYPYLKNKKINEQINVILEREINNLKKKVNIDQSNDSLIINYEIYEHENTISFVVLKKYLSDNNLNINTYIFEKDTGMIIYNIFIKDKLEDLKANYNVNTNFVAITETQIIFYTINDNELTKEKLDIKEIKDYLKIYEETKEIEQEEPNRIIDPEKPMVALTFDDGPHPKYGPPIIETLKQYNSVATFFEVGYMLKNYSYVSLSAKEIGCEIGSHTYNHTNMKKAKKEKRIEEINKMNELYFSIFNEYPTLLRPPYGAYDTELTNVTDQALILWSIDTNDWQTRNKEKIIKHIKEQGNLDGQVILMHSIYKETADAVAELVPWLIEEGYQLVTITELIENKYNTNTINEKIFGYYYFG